VEGANGCGQTSLLAPDRGFLAPAAGRLVVKTWKAKMSDAEEARQARRLLGHQAASSRIDGRRQLDFFAASIAAEADTPGAGSRWGWAAPRP